MLKFLLFCSLLHPIHLVKTKIFEEVGALGESYLYNVVQK